MAKVIIIYSTTDGHTRKICNRLQEVVAKNNHQVSVFSIDDESSVDLNAYDKIVIGASIRYGKHNIKVYDFIKTHLQVLEETPSVFFSVNVVARKPGKNQPDTNPYVKKFLRQIAWKPKNVAVIAGKIDYQKYNFWDRNIIRMIMWITKGPTHPDTNIEFTDWRQVEAFGVLISEM